MRTVTVQRAKAYLSALLHAVEDGEEVEIRRGARPVARLVPRRHDPPHAAAAIGDARNHVFVSAVSFWEIAIKHARGKLPWPADGFEVLLGSAIAKLPILPDHAISAGRLPPHHADPFDRMLVAQGTADELTLVGADRSLPHTASRRSGADRGHAPSRGGCMGDRRRHAASGCPIPGAQPRGVPPGASLSLMR